jgi:hypothetical protein
LLEIHPSVPNAACATLWTRSTTPTDNDNDNDLMSFNNDPGERDQCQKLAVGDDEERHGVINFDKAVRKFDKGKKRVAEDDEEENPGASKHRRYK